MEANFKDKEEQLRQQVSLEFFDSLPEEMQIAAKYVADGGRDYKGLFRALSQSMETSELSATDPKDSETIVREFLSVTNYGTPDEIEEELTSLKDMNKLEEKAEKFKPKLDKMRQEQVQTKLAQQEATRKQQEDASRNYMNNVYDTLKPAELNGLKLDKKTQGLLYNGLVQAQYPSVSGRPTNLFGHLIEKYQFVEPNHGLIAEALWLLADPDGYRSKVKEAGATDNAVKTVRTLKTEQSRSISSSPVSEKEETPAGRKIQRPSQNFFKR